jgi:uncharacterized protein with PIN domain
MRVCVFDASAVLRFVEDGPGAARVEQLILQALRGELRIVISAVNWGEVFYVITRQAGEEWASAFAASFRELGIEIVLVDREGAELAASFRSKFPCLMPTRLLRLSRQARAPLF